MYRALDLLIDVKTMNRKSCDTVSLSWPRLRNRALLTLKLILTLPEEVETKTVKYPIILAGILISQYTYI